MARYLSELTRLRAVKQGVRPCSGDASLSPPQPPFATRDGCLRGSTGTPLAPSPPSLPPAPAPPPSLLAAGATGSPHLSPGCHTEAAASSPRRAGSQDGHGPARQPPPRAPTGPPTPGLPPLLAKPYRRPARPCAERSGADGAPPAPPPPGEEAGGSAPPRVRAPAPRLAAPLTARRRWREAGPRPPAGPRPHS